MSSAYVIPMGLVLISNIAYHLCQKGIPADVNPYVSLLVTYATALLVTVIALLFLDAPQASGTSAWSLLSWNRVNWTSVGVGFAAVGLEFGYLWAYRAGWKLSLAALYSNVLVTLALIPIGILVFHDGLNLRKCGGIVLALSGLWALSGI